MISCLPFRLLSFPRDQSRDVTNGLGKGWWFFIFRVFKSILFFVNWNSLYVFQLLYSTNMLCLLLLYLIWFLNTLLLFFRRISTVRSQGINHGMWPLAWAFLLIKSVLHFAFLHLLSGYDYCDYVVIGVLRPSWFTEILFWIGLLLSKEVMQLKILIIIIMNEDVLTVGWNQIKLASMQTKPSTSCSLIIKM